MISSRDVGADVAELTARHALQAVDQLGERHLRRIAHQKVDVIVLPGARHQLRLKVLADFGEDGREVADGKLGQYVAAVFRDKDQVRVQRVNDVPASSNIHVAAPETNL
jgi:hypothetical protein